jgi:hypothetical protein
MPRKIKSGDWFKEVSGQTISPTVTVSGTGCSGGFDFLPNNTIRISFTTTSEYEAISCTTPFAFEVADMIGVGITTAADQGYELRNGSDLICSVQAETTSTVKRTAIVSNDYKAVAKGATLKMYATSTGGAAVMTVKYVPG